MSRSMLPGWSNCSSANLISFGIFKLFVFSLEGGVVPVMLDKTAQSSVVCQSVFLDLKWIEKLWCVSVFTLLMPWMGTCVWVLDNLKRCTHLSVVKCDWEPLSNMALHGTLTRSILNLNNGCCKKNVISGNTLQWKVSVDFCSCCALCICRMVIVCGRPLDICYLILFSNVKHSMMTLVTLPAQLLRACVRFTE